MSNIGAIIDYIESAMGKILEAVGQLENRIIALEQRIEYFERASTGSGAYGAPPPSRREPVTQTPVMPPVMQDTRRSPPPSPPAPQPQPYANPQSQWAAPRQDNYSQPQTPSYQSRPPAPSYPPQGQQPQPAPQGYAPQGYGPPGQPPQQQGPPGPRPPPNPLNIRQEMTGELKDIFARMRARAEGRQ